MNAPRFRIAPLAAALAALFMNPIGIAQQLPDLPASNSDAPVRLSPQGSANSSRLDATHRTGSRLLTASTEWSKQNALSVLVRGGLLPSDGIAVGGGLRLGSSTQEAFATLGWQPVVGHRLLITASGQQQEQEFNFLSGKQKTSVSQTGVGGSWRMALSEGRERALLRFVQLDAWRVQSDSRDLADRNYSVDSAPLYELWSDPRRIAGATSIGLQAKLSLAPWADSRLDLGLGSERMQWDYLTGAQTSSKAVGSIEWQQQLAEGIRLKAGINTQAAQSRTTLGFDSALPGGQRWGLEWSGIRGQNGIADDQRLTLIWTLPLERTAGGISPSTQIGSRGANFGGGLDESLLDQASLRPAWIPAQVMARVDTTARPTRLVAVDKTGIPAGATVSSGGIITAPLGAVALGIASVTLNGGAFANGGQFAVSGSNIVINPNLITQPAVGVTDTYVVTVNKAGGGTLLVTITVTHGSVKVDSVTVGAGGADLTAPTTTVAPAVTGTTSSGTTLTATINEAGTGYYLVQPAASAAPNAAAVIAANHSFAMTAATQASVAISGLTASTAYKVYFVAKDTAGNAQAAVASASFSTSAAADVTAPTTTVAPAVTGTTSSGTTLTATIDEAGTGYYLVQPAASAAPMASAVIAANHSFAMTAASQASVAISGLTASTAYKVYFVAKDAAGNAQSSAASVSFSTSAAAADTTPDDFDFSNKTNQAFNTVVTTNTITVTGIDTSVTANTTQGTLVKNGTDTGAASTTVVAGDTLAVKLTTSANPSTSINCTVTIGTGTDNFSVTTTANVAPVISSAISNQIYNGGVTTISAYNQSGAITELTLPAATDANTGDTLTYSVSGLPAGLGFNPTTRKITGAPSGSGTSSVTYTVTDHAGATDSKTFNITINTPPVVTVAPVLASGLGYGATQYGRTLTFSDSGALTIILWSFDNGTINVTSASGGSISGNNTREVTITGATSGTVVFDYTSPSPVTADGWGYDFLDFTIIDSGGLANGGGGAGDSADYTY